MIFLFKDKQRSIKHLCFIIESKKINTQTLKIKEALNQAMIVEDLLYYEDEKIMNADIRRLYGELKKYSELVQRIKEANQIGFINAEGHEDENGEDEDEDE